MCVCVWERERWFIRDYLSTVRVVYAHVALHLSRSQCVCVMCTHLDLCCACVWECWSTTRVFLTTIWVPFWSFYNEQLFTTHTVQFTDMHWTWLSHPTEFHLAENRLKPVLHKSLSNKTTISVCWRGKTFKSIKHGPWVLLDARIHFVCSQVNVEPHFYKGTNTQPIWRWKWFAVKKKTLHLMKSTKMLSGIQSDTEWDTIFGCLFDIFRSNSPANGVHM